MHPLADECDLKSQNFRNNSVPMKSIKQFYNKNN